MFLHRYIYIYKEINIYIYIIFILFIPATDQFEHSVQSGDSIQLDDSIQFTMSGVRGCAAPPRAAAASLRGWIELSN